MLNSFSMKYGVNLLKACIILTAIVWSIFPILLIILSSFKRNNDIFSTPFKFAFEITFENYTNLWLNWPIFFDSLFNSLMITSGATALTIAVSAFAGWAYSRCHDRYLTWSAFGLIILRLLPPIVITIPLFPLANFFGFNDTYGWLIFLYATFFISLGSWIMKAFFDQVPIELEESAQCDGANISQTMRFISFPLGVPGMIATGVFVFIHSWNDYLFAFIFSTSKAKTAPVILSEMMGSATGVDWGVVFAAATIQLVPIAVFFIFVQKYLIEGLTAGSVKG